MTLIMTFITVLLSGDIYNKTQCYLDFYNKMEIFFQGLAVDPIEDVLYWTDSINHTINYLRLSEPKQQAKILFVFETSKPQDITIDICHRFIYWTNSYRKKPSIERAKIGSQTIELIVNTDLGMPAGITVDYRTQRLYWADIRGGIYYRIESTNLEGKERQIVYEGTHIEPFAISVKNEHLYFTDLRKNALWKFDLTNITQPQEIQRFECKPMGLIAKKTGIKKLPDCQKLEEAYKNYSKLGVELFDQYKLKETPKQIECIHGTLVDGLCKCSKGFSGSFCEVSLCHNYCLVGSCHLTNQGYPYCHCPTGLGGTRCERDCDGYCMNGGKCSFSFPNAKLPNCKCLEGFKGPRCEENVITGKLCDLYCNNEIGENENSKQEFSYCRCTNRNYINVYQPQPLIVATENSSSYISYIHDPVFISLSCVTLFASTVSIILTICILYLRRKPTPKIRRRYIVNKNPPTSMTERPSHSEQCEITIEDCCNMNVCETPCFEPSRLQSYHQSRSDDKKVLLSNMEKPEDLY